MPILRRFFGRTGPQPFGLPAPDQAFCAIGDVHGCDELMAALLARIVAERPHDMIVCAGDYIDRGPDSAGVLARLRAAQGALPGRVVCLMGNHERMLLEFLADPAANGPRWLRNGGAETLASFGVAADADAAPAAAADIAAELLERMPSGLAAWLAALPLAWNSGNVWVVHAAADPARPMSDQSADVLQWGHPAFARVPRRDGQWVVHGHTITAQPLVVPGRIAVDTGAVFSGVLTAAAIDPVGEIAFIQT